MKYSEFSPYIIQLKVKINTRCYMVPLAYTTYLYGASPVGEYYLFIQGSVIKAMAPHSSTLAWKIPWMEEPGRLQSMGSLRVGHDFNFTFAFMRWRRKRQPAPVFLPGESQGRWNLVGCRLWGRTESDTTEAT